MDNKTKLVFLKPYKYAFMGYDVVVCRVGDILHVPDKYVKELQKKKIARLAKDDELTEVEITDGQKAKRDAFDASQVEAEKESAVVAEKQAEINDLSEKLQTANESVAKVTELEDEITELIEVGESAVRTIQEDTEKFEEATTTIATRDGEIGQLKSDLETANSAIAERDKEIVQLKSDLDTATKPEES